MSAAKTDTAAQRSARIAAQLVATKQRLRWRLSPADRALVENRTAQAPALNLSQQNRRALAAPPAVCLTAEQEGVVQLCVEKFKLPEAQVRGLVLAQKPRQVRGTGAALFSITAEQQHGNPDFTAWLATVADTSGASMDAALAILAAHIDEVVAIVTGDATAQKPRPVRWR